MKRFLIACVALLLSACGSLKFNTDSAGAGLFLQGVTMKYIERVPSPEARAARAFSLVSAARDARTMLDFQGVSIDELKAAMVMRVQNADLEVSDKVLLMELIAMIESDVNAGIEDGEVSEGTSVTVNAALDRIERAASFYLTDMSWAGGWGR